MPAISFNYYSIFYSIYFQCTFAVVSYYILHKIAIGFINKFKCKTKALDTSRAF